MDLESVSVGGLLGLIGELHHPLRFIIYKIVIFNQRGNLQTQRRPQKYLDESSPMTVVVLRTPENLPEHSLGVIEVYLK